MANTIPVPRQIPRMPGSRPFFGHFLEIRRDRLAFFLRVREQCGDIGLYRRMSRPVILITGPAYIQTALVDQAHKTGVPKRAQMFLRPIIGEGITADKSDTYTRAFQPQRNQRYAEIVVDYTERMQQQWGSGSTIDVAREMMRLSLGIIGKTLFDADVLGEADELGAALTTVLHVTNVRAQSLLPLPRANREFNQAVDRLNSTVHRIITERRASEDRGDLLSMLIGSGMNDQQVRDAAMTFFLAGLETTATALSWTWYLLALEPESYASLRNEVDHVLVDRLPTYADLPNLPYTLQVFKESLRLYPPIHLITRQVQTEPINLDGGYQLPAGAYFAISFYALHRRADLFPNPDSFKPQRWTAEFEQQLPRCAYLPFSAGPQTCLGKHFATMVAQLVLATLSRDIIFEPVTRNVQPRALITLRPQGEVNMIVRRRHPHKT